MDREQPLVIDRFAGNAGRQRDHGDPAAALFRPALAYVVDHDVAHDAADVGEECRAVALRQRAVLEILEKALVHQRGRIQLVDAAALAQIAVREALEIAVDDLE